jgi:outer membrane receptor protein involved in Fe transport
VNPKVGVNWELNDAFSLRASYGQSFRAPNLSDLDPAGTLSRRQVRGLNIADAGAPSGRSNIILILGANPGLREQTAESWSGGLTFAPPESGLRLELNYFDVSFQDRIASITNVAGALNPNSEFASLINRAPDPALIATLLAEAAALGTSGGFSPSDITVIVDARSTNLAITDVRGMDASLSYAFDLGPGEMTLRADATYLFEFLRAASPAARAVDVVDTVSNPVDLRARLGAAWRTDHITLSGFVNYTDGFRDNLSAPQRDVDAWTTVDLHASLRLGAREDEHGEHEAGPELSLSVINLFDEEPPFVNNSAGVGYDPANADPLGRFVAFEISTRF